MAVTLPDAPWRHRGGLDRLAEILGGGDWTRFVGGAVRDTFLGETGIADIDFATRLPPDAVLDRLASANVRAVPTGLAHGTVTAVLGSGPIEITTLRRDVSTDGRHAVVAFTDDWQEDAGRRDFTINALYADPSSGRVHDYFGGLRDLAERRVRFIGDPLQRISEDHLRILRFFRFHARFGDAIDENGLSACIARANDLMTLSRERIAAEMLKLVVARSAVPVIALMIDRGILRAVLPEIDEAGVDRLSRLVDAEHNASIAASPIRRLAALLPPGTADAVGARLRLSNLDRKQLAAATLGPGDEGPRALAYRFGTDSAVDRLLLAGLDPAPITTWHRPVLPISGGALVRRGLAKGPQVAATLRAIETQWIAEGFPGSDRVETLAGRAVAQALGGNGGAIIEYASAADNGRAKK